jgi:hypothetical protein
MRATVWPHRIDILGASGASKELWELLDELKPQHVPPVTPTGKRLSVVLNPEGRLDAFICRTPVLPDEEVIRILSKYGIEGSIGSENVSSE